MDDRFAFCKVTWLTRYRGESIDESRYRRISTGESDGGERYLFLPFRGSCYGYVHLSRTDPDDDDTIRTINLGRLSSSARAESLDGVHIIWIASRLEGGGICVVGEYLNATVVKSAKGAVSGRPSGWNIRAHKSDVHMIPEDKRVTLSGVRLRRGNLWYAQSASGRTTRKNAIVHVKRYGVPLK